MFDTKKIQSDNFRAFIEEYSSKYNLIKSNFIANAFLRDELGISSELLRAKHKKEEVINLLKFANKEFLAILKEDQKFEKINVNTFKLIKN